MSRRLYDKIIVLTEVIIEDIELIKTLRDQIAKSHTIEVNLDAKVKELTEDNRRLTQIHVNKSRQILIAFLNYLVRNDKLLMDLESIEDFIKTNQYFK